MAEKPQVRIPTSVELQSRPLTFPARARTGVPAATSPCPPRTARASRRPGPVARPRPRRPPSGAPPPPPPLPSSSGQPRPAEVGRPKVRNEPDWQARSDQEVRSQRPRGGLLTSSAGSRALSLPVRFFANVLTSNVCLTMEANLIIFVKRKNVHESYLEELVATLDIFHCGLTSSSSCARRLLSSSDRRRAAASSRSF